MAQICLFWSGVMTQIANLLLLSTPDPYLQLASEFIFLLFTFLLIPWGTEYKPNRSEFFSLTWGLEYIMNNLEPLVFHTRNTHFHWIGLIAVNSMTKRKNGHNLQSSNWHWHHLLSSWPLQTNIPWSHLSCKGLEDPTIKGKKVEKVTLFIQKKRKGNA